jgi:UDP-N-acetylglucosamine--dolichyl-phosphate N-acetylglucosaminephosphotransferase
MPNIIIFLIGFLVVFILMPIAIKKLRNRDIIGIDVHKLERPKIPEMGGITILLGLIFVSFFLNILSPYFFKSNISFIFTVLTAGIIGAIDDLKPLNARIKPFLTLFAGIPILVLRTYEPSIYFPFIGGTRLTLIYPFLVPIAIAVTSNAVNMMDPFNGVMSGTCIILTSSLLISSLILARDGAVLLCSALLGLLFAFYFYNKYPSKVFSGDVGSLSVGAAIGAIAIIGKMEVVTVTAFMAHIMNAFYGLSSMGKLYERREVTRPTKLLEDGRIIASKDKNAPITLARFILARGPLSEPEIVKIFLIYSFICGILSILTCFFLVVFA